MNDDHQPCPFCNGINTARVLWDGRYECYVTCTACRAGGPVVNVLDLVDTSEYNAEEAQVAAWDAWDKWIQNQGEMT